MEEILKYGNLVSCIEKDDGTIVFTFDKEIDEQILRKSIIAELEAINMYEAFSEFALNDNVRNLLKDIANEEKVHVGEFLKLLLDIDKKQVEGLKKGRIEVEEIEK